jgi:hypothetical protein
VRPFPRPLRILPSALLFATAATLAAAQTPTLAVNVSTGRYPISPYIYGLANYGVSTDFATEIKVPVVRWGGDGTTRYNWQYDSSNAGYDWYFMSGSGTTNPTPSASVDTMVSTYQPGQSLITIPIIPYINNSAAWNCSFPVAVYGAQQSVNPYVQVNGGNCGNSIASNGSQLADSTISSNNLDNTPALQQAWVSHLVSKFGAASAGGVLFYQLDNEPYGWGNTHRDVEPTGTTYPIIVSLGQQYAAAVKAADPSANVLGPSDFTLGGWIGDLSQQNNEFAGIYYLQQMAAYQQTNGTRLLDYFDEHYYFNFTDQPSQLASTRTLWDPTYNGGTWVEQYYFDGPMQLIPRFQSWISSYYPGTKLSLSEYSIDSGNKTIVDALAEMDVLAIFGRQQLDLATMWSPPAPTDPIAYSFRMFRNYDGQGSQYGDTFVSSTSTDQTRLAVYASQRSTDNTVTILVINKTTAAIATTLALSGATLPTSAATYSYSGSNLNAIVNVGSTTISNGSLSYNFPGYSATLFTLAPVALSPTTAALTASPNPASIGQQVTLTATVAPSGSGATGTPSGNITFSVNGVRLGSASLNSSGVATLTESSNGLPIGAYPLIATYPGSGTFAASTSPALTVTLAKAPTTTGFTASPSTVTSGSNVTLSATVSRSAAQVTGTPQGTVTFAVGSYVIATAKLTAGTAQVTASSAGIPTGSYPITATYNGDSSDVVSTSSTVTVTVQ